ncbi:Antizyme inhibitor 2 [Varanus komodoensis]|nr:Antizyme inhibitor 2 [Varanus komodoensis]
MARCLDESDIMMVEEGFTTRDLLENLLLDAAQPGSRKPFFVADLEAVVKKHLRLLKALPRIKPFYALKCNHGKGVVQMLAALGAGFGCTNKAEVELVKSTGVPSDRIICTSPCKQISLIRYAARQGLQLMTFDNEVELGKIARSHPSARMILCLAADDSRSSSRLSMKFGATLKTCRHLLETAKEMNVEVVGISLHTGGSCTDLQIITPSIADARLVFEMGAELGYKMHLLDIGGVFPGAEESRGRLEETAAVVNSALDLYFPEGCGVEIIAELGRYYVDSAFTLAVNIVAKREVPLPGSEDAPMCRTPPTFLTDLRASKLLLLRVCTCRLPARVCPRQSPSPDRACALLPSQVEDLALVPIESHSAAFNPALKCIKITLYHHFVI